LEADGEALKVKVEEEEKERAVLRVVARKERGQVMEIKDMLDESDEQEKRGLVSTSGHGSRVEGWGYHS
jgi:hypothetical protein